MVPVLRSGLGKGSLFCVMNSYAVLTGDLVRSRELSPERRQEALERLRQLARDFEELHPGSVEGNLEIFRGDSWQLCLGASHLGVTAAVFFRAGLKMQDFDSRIGIGIGPVDLLQPDRISESSGPAFEQSGQALDSLENFFMALAFCESPPPGAEFLPKLVIPLLDARVSEWTDREALAIIANLWGLTQQETAEWPPARARHGGKPTRQAIQDALARSQWKSLIQPALTEIEKALIAK